MLGENKALDYFLGSYRDFVTLRAPSRRTARCHGSGCARQSSALVHCTTGKDRTGWATASLLLLLGLDEDAVFHEYLLTNEQLLPAFASIFDKFTAAGGDPELLKQVLGVRPEYLQAALTQMREKFGSIEGYFADGLGIDVAGQDAIRAHTAGGLRAAQTGMRSGRASTRAPPDRHDAYGVGRRVHTEQLRWIGRAPCSTSDTAANVSSHAAVHPTPIRA